MNNKEIALELTKIFIEARKNIVFDGKPNEKETQKILEKFINIYKKIFDEVKKLDN